MRCCSRGVITYLASAFHCFRINSLTGTGNCQGNHCACSLRTEQGTKILSHFLQTSNTPRVLTLLFCLGWGQSSPFLFQEWNIVRQPSNWFLPFSMYYFPWKLFSFPARGKTNAESYHSSTLSPFQGHAWAIHCQRGFRKLVQSQEPASYRLYPQGGFGCKHSSCSNPRSARLPRPVGWPLPPGHPVESSARGAQPPPAKPSFQK